MPVVVLNADMKTFLRKLEKFVSFLNECKKRTGKILGVLRQALQGRNKKKIKKGKKWVKEKRGRHSDR